MSYIHHIPGRMRIRMPELKGNTARAAALKGWLKTLRGIVEVEINPLTGSVLIYYRDGILDGDILIAKLRQRGCIEVPPRPRPRPVRHYSQASEWRSPALERTIAKTILKYAAEFAIERSVLALAAAIL